MQKKAKSGKTLDGVYKRTNVSFSLHEKPLNFDDVSIVDFMLTKLNSYDSEYIKMICKSEGSCHFLIGIFSSSNVMFEFGANTIKRLSTLNVGVKFDFYGGED